MTESSTILDPHTSFEFPYSAFVKHASRALIIADVEGHILDVNQPYLELTRFSRDDVAGRRLDALARALPTDGGRPDLVELLLLGGERVVRAVYSAEILDETGDKTGYVHIYYEPER
ncbi:MAG TPA: PAS domain S-box protein [Thermoanaerobaculia bacterium]